MMGVHLIEPEAHATRGNFHCKYAVQRVPQGRAHIRLLDCMVTCASHGDGDYFESSGPGLFEVVDVVTREKAWFEMPYGSTPETITRMISSHFDSTAFQVGNKTWFV